MSKPIKKIVIAGGGSAGWITAAALSSKFDLLLDITLVESEQIGTVGVGEATIPTAQTFHSLIGINEQAFMRATNATFKLGISFENWGKIGDKYIHSFGEVGQSSWLASFHHFWLYAKSQGIETNIDDFSFESQAALTGKFEKNQNHLLNYAYHLDSSLYAKLLREKAQSRGVRRIEGVIQEVKQHPATGDISSLVLNNGEEVSGDLFIDCTGFRALLIGDTLKTGFEHWQQYLPCNCAIAVQTEQTDELLPLTRSIAHNAGWRWRIPLQNRVGNGIVFSNNFISEDEATHRLLESIDGRLRTDPRVIRFQSGRREKVWHKNCVALGLSTGFIEPLESTSIHLFMTGITRLMELFPFSGISDTTRNEYNRLCRDELIDIRDFIILHYHLTQRDDSEFWNYCRHMSVPSTLEHRMELFKTQGHAYQGGEDLFRIDSWVQVMLGQGLVPQNYHYMVKNMPVEKLRPFLDHVRQNIEKKVSSLKTHQHFIKSYGLVA